MATLRRTRVPAALAAAAASLRPAAVPLLIVGGALALRLAGLGQPDRLYFDEVYYVEDARALLHQGVEDGFAVHPPVGKWLIAAGIALIGDTPLGWRAVPALAGTALVAVVYLLALRLLRSRGAAALAAGLVAVDGVAITMSRIAMLDIFVALFVAAAALLLAVDRDQRDTHVTERVKATAEQERATAEHERATAAQDRHATEREKAATERDRRAAELGNCPDRETGAGAHVEHAAQGDAGSRARSARRTSWARWAAGGLLGLAVAAKWSGAFALVAACLLVLASDLLRRRRRGEALLAHPLRLVGAVLVPLAVVPAAVYVASYAGWFAGFEHTRQGQRACEAVPCDVGPGELVAAWANEQRAIARFHRDLEATHGYRAPATTWPVMTRPVVSYFESCRPDRDVSAGPCEVAPGTAAMIIVLGNPALWWWALAAYPLLAWAAVRRRDGPAAWILVLLLAQYLPWLAAGRPVFFFYTAPLVPFVALSSGWLVTRLPRRARRAAGWALALAAVAAAAFWYPVWAGAEMPDGAWRSRMLLRSWY